MSVLNELKKTVFFDLLNAMGRVFIIVRYSEDVQVGTRGFLPAERENGLVLVFNTKMSFTWHDDGVIEAKLIFGTKSEDCLIPVDHIIAVYLPELQTQFITTYAAAAAVTPAPEAAPAVQPEASDVIESKILKVDFTKKKKK